MEVVNNSFIVFGSVCTFPSPSGWHFVTVPKNKIDNLKNKKGHWGFIPAEFAYKTHTWKSSLLPMGNGDYFIALRASLRKRENIKIGDKVKLSVTIL